MPKRKGGQRNFDDIERELNAIRRAHQRGGSVKTLGPRLRALKNEAMQIGGARIKMRKYRITSNKRVVPYNIYGKTPLQLFNELEGYVAKHKSKINENMLPPTAEGMLLLIQDELNKRYEEYKESMKHVLTFLHEKGYNRNLSEERKDAIIDNIFYHSPNNMNIPMNVDDKITVPKISKDWLGQLLNKDQMKIFNAPLKLIKTTVPGKPKPYEWFIGGFGNRYEKSIPFKIMLAYTTPSVSHNRPIAVSHDHMKVMLDILAPGVSNNDESIFRMAAPKLSNKENKSGEYMIIVEYKNGDENVIESKKD